MPKKRVLEKTVVKNIREALDKHYPGFYFKVYGSVFQKVGIPDIVGCYKGKFIAIEVKAPGKENNLTKIQETCINKIKLAGGLAFMSSSPQHVMEVMANEFGTDGLSGRGKKVRVRKKKIAVVYGSRDRENSSNN